MMKTKVLLGSFLLLTAINVNAQQKYELSVKEAVDLAFRNVIELKNARIDLQIQEAKNKEILGSAYPQVTGNVGLNHYLKLPGILFPDATATQVYGILKDEGVQGSGGAITDVPEPVMRLLSFQQPWNMAAGATLTQLLFQPDVFVGLQARKTALDLSASQIEQISEKVKDSAYKRYYAILIAQKQLGFLDQGVSRLRKLYSDDSIMYKNGFIERLEMDKVQVQINNLTTIRNQVASAVNLSYAGLKFAIGLSQADTVVLKDDLNSANIRENLLENDFKYEDRVEIRTLGYAKELQKLDLKRYKLGYIPTVAAMANYSLNGQGPDFLTSGNTTWINSSFIGLNVNIPIFDGFQRRYKVQQSQFKLQQVENTISNVKQAIDLEQVFTKESLLTAITNLDIQEKNMLLAEKVYNTTKVKFQEGVTTSSFEVIQAENDLQTAQSNYFNALYSAVVARISYLKSLGKLK
jgi:outer membrane protein